MKRTMFHQMYPLRFRVALLAATAIVIFTQCCCAQGTWTPVATLAPHYNGGVMLLLTDGSVITKTYYGGFGTTPGTTWDRLTPDATGSYVHGTWSTIAQMHNDRLYFSSWVLNDGRVYVGGGEYGGSAQAEIYTPKTNTWDTITTPGGSFMDGVSENLAGGQLLLGVISPNSLINYIYDPATNTYTTGPSNTGSHDEVSWLKLADGSILQVSIYSTNSERYIPATNTWVADGTLPVMLFDPYDLECGAAILLPDGRGFFMGSTGHTAYYTPSGDATPGTWTAGPDIPGGKGTTDAPVAMLNNGRLLMAVSPIPTYGGSYPALTSFYEFDYTTNTFTSVTAPGGGATLSVPTYNTCMLDLPDGSVMFTSQASKHYYIYNSTGSPLSAGKPAADTVIRKNCDTFAIAGSLFTGISEGAAFGDDWAMSTNFPIVRINSGTTVYYARSFNWNRYGTVMTGSLPDTVLFELPAGLAVGNYTAQVIVNGNASAPVSFSTMLSITPSSAVVCTGNTAVLNATAAAGMWSSSNTLVATVGSATGMVTGVSAGTASITFTDGACQSIAAVSVNPLSSITAVAGAGGSISPSGVSSVCPGAPATYTISAALGYSIANVVADGASFGAVGTYTFAPVTAGSHTISAAFVPVTYTISATPGTGGNVSPAGTTVVAYGGSEVYSFTPTSGYHLSNVQVDGASMGAVPVYSFTSVSANHVLSAGFAADTYSVTVTSTTGGTVSPGSIVSSYGDSPVFSFSPSPCYQVADVQIDGSSIGPVPVYTFSAVSASHSINVSFAPVAVAITGPTAVCAGSGITVSASVSGGSWSSGDTAIVAVGATSGSVTGVAPGVAVVTYTTPAGCIATTAVTVQALPSAFAAGALCAGSVATLTDPVAGGSWSVSDPAIATVSGLSGLLTAVSAGVVSVAYTLPGGCSVSEALTVNPVPLPITGSPAVCPGNTTVLSDATTGGSWSSSNSAIASVGSLTGIVNGVAAGSSTISYVLPGGCWATFAMSVDATPAPVTGSGSVCPGASITLSDASAGGTWSSSDPATAVVGSSTGTVTGIVSGSVLITYTWGSCGFVTLPVSVASAPAAITGSLVVCPGTSATLTDASGGGTWSSANTGIVTVGSTCGVITGVSAGNAAVTYSLGSCGAVTAIVTVNPLPGAISGVGALCTGASAALSDPVPGGCWISGNPMLASINPVSGIVTGISAGSVNISYSMGCAAMASTALTINPTPDAGVISGPGALCIGGAAVLSNTVPGGTWAATNVVATINSATGAMSGVNRGTDTIRYQVTNGLCNNFSSSVVAVVPPAGNIYTLAGTGVNSYSGDGAASWLATIQGPRDMVADNAGNLYFCDVTSNVIRKIAPTGVITTVVGNGSAGNGGDGGPATAASLNCPNGIFVDHAGNLLFSNTSSHTIRKVNLSTGIITTIAGVPGIYGSTGDGGPASAAKFSSPLGLCGDAAGNIYIADQCNYKVRKIDGVTGLVSTIAGTGSSAYSGDGGPGTAARVSSVRGLALDNGNNLYIVDGANGVIRKLSLTCGMISTVAGNGIMGYSGDGGPGTAAKLSSPAKIVFDGAKYLYISDMGNNRIRQLNLFTGIVNTFAGNGTGGFSGDGGAAVAARIYQPYGVACDNNGSVFIGDAANRRIRVAGAKASIAISLSGSGTIPAGSPVTFSALSSIPNAGTYQWQKNGVNTGLNAATFTDASPANGDVYRCVLAVSPDCGSATTDTSNAIVVNVFAPPSGEPLIEHAVVDDGEARVFPNPGHDAISIEATGLKSGEAVLTIMNEVGKTIACSRLPVAGERLSESVNVSELTPGIYFISLVDGSGKLLRIKFVKI